MKFSDKLYSLLTARGGVIKYSEFFYIVESLLNEEYKKKSSAFISPGLIVTRWLSEGFLEVNAEKGGFQLKRPSLYSCGAGKWVYVGARYSPAIDYLKSALELVSSKPDEYAAPKLVFSEKPSMPLNRVAACRFGCDVYGDSETTAAQVLALKAGSLSTRTTSRESECDQYMLGLRWFRLDATDFSLIEAEVSELTPGHYILRNQRGSGRPIWIYVKLLANNKVVQYEDWRWLYVSLLSESRKMSEFFYVPDKELLCINRITGPYTRQENWLPRELAECLGAASETKSITTKTVQDVDGLMKTVVVYPNIKRRMALHVHDALGMNKTHPLRYLQF